MGFAARAQPLAAVLGLKRPPAPAQWPNAGSPGRTIARGAKAFPPGAVAVVVSATDIVAHDAQQDSRRDWHVKWGKSRLLAITG
jgi:hypothetical protein